MDAWPRGDHWAAQRILDDIRMFGHTDIIMKGDEVQREIVDKRSAGSVPQNPLAHDSQGNGGRARRPRVHEPDACDEDRAWSSASR